MPSERIAAERGSAPIPRAGDFTKNQPSPRRFARPASDELKRKSCGVAPSRSRLRAGRFCRRREHRLLSSEDYGLTGMAATLTGFLGLFKDAGLSAATVQRRGVTHEHISTLFWI